MPTYGTSCENLSPHLRYFEQKCMAKGASQWKAKEWAYRMVRKGKRQPDEATR